MYDPQPGMYDDVMASDLPMIGTTFTQCERKPLHITSPCKSENYDIIGNRGIGLVKENKNLFLCRPNLKPAAPRAFNRFEHAPRFVELTKIEAGNIKTEGILNGNLSPAMYEVDQTSLASPGLNFAKKTLRGVMRETRGLESALAAIPNSEYGLKETQSLEYAHLGGGQQMKGPVVDVAGWASCSVPIFHHRTNRQGKSPKRPGSTVPGSRSKSNGTPRSIGTPRCTSSHAASRPGITPTFCQRGRGLARRQGLKDLMAFSEQRVKHRPDRSGSLVDAKFHCAKPNCYVFHRDTARTWVNG